MKKKSTLQSAFFNLRFSVGLFVGMTGISLALFAANPFRPAAGRTQQKYDTPKYDPKARPIDISLLPPGFDCAKVHELGIDRMENLRAGMIMIACGLSEGGKPS